MRLKEGEQHVDDVSSALKRFLRDLPDGLFTRAQRLTWLEASGGWALQPVPSLRSRPVQLACPFLSPDSSPFPLCTWARHSPADRLQFLLLWFPIHIVALHSQGLLSDWWDLT